MRFLLSILVLCPVLATVCMAETIVPKQSKNCGRYNGCEIVPTAYADGDSFRVRIGQDEFVLRLYYVDAPGSDERLPGCNAEQAHYFGINPPESVAAGKAATK